MSKLLVFVAGVLAGVVLAQRLARTPGGTRVLGAVQGTTDEFLRAVGDSYRARLDEGR